MQSFIRYFALDRIDLRKGIIGMSNSRIQLFNSKVIQCGEQDDPHNVIRCVTCTRRHSLQYMSLQTWRQIPSTTNDRAKLTETKSHSPSKLLGTPTRFRYWSLHSVSARANVHRASNETPSHSVAGLHNCRDIWRAVRARECAAR